MSHLIVVDLLLQSFQHGILVEQVTDHDDACPLVSSRNNLAREPVECLVPSLASLYGIGILDVVKDDEIRTMFAVPHASDTLLDRADHYFHIKFLNDDCGCITEVISFLGERSEVFLEQIIVQKFVLDVEEVLS